MIKKSLLSKIEGSFFIIEKYQSKNLIVHISIFKKLANPCKRNKFKRYIREAIKNIDIKPQELIIKLKKEALSKNYKHLSEDLLKLLK